MPDEFDFHYPLIGGYHFPSKDGNPRLRSLSVAVGMGTGTLALWDQDRFAKPLPIQELEQAILYLRAEYEAYLNGIAQKHSLLALLGAIRANARQYADALRMGIAKFTVNFLSIPFNLVSGGTFSFVAGKTLDAMGFLAASYDREPTLYTEDTPLSQGTFDPIRGGKQQGPQIALGFLSDGLQAMGKLVGEDFWETMNYRDFRKEYRRALDVAKANGAAVGPLARDPKIWTNAGLVTKGAGIGWSLFNLYTDAKDADQKMKKIGQHQSELKRRAAAIAFRTGAWSRAQTGWDVLQWGEYLNGRVCAPDEIQESIAYDMSHVRTIAKARLAFEAVYSSGFYGKQVVQPELSPAERRQREQQDRLNRSMQKAVDALHESMEAAEEKERRQWLREKFEDPARDDLPWMKPIRPARYRP